MVLARHSATTLWGARQTLWLPAHRGGQLPAPGSSSAVRSRLAEPRTTTPRRVLADSDDGIAMTSGTCRPAGVGTWASMER